MDELLLITVIFNWAYS